MAAVIGFVTLLAFAALAFLAVPLVLAPVAFIALWVQRRSDRPATALQSEVVEAVPAQQHTTSTRPVVAQAA